MDSFENNLKKLEEIVSTLESGKCNLDDALKLYSDGVVLSAECKKQLTDARGKIEQLADYKGS